MQWTYYFNDLGYIPYSYTNRVPLLEFGHKDIVKENWITTILELTCFCSIILMPVIKQHASIHVHYTYYYARACIHVFNNIICNASVHFFRINISLRTHTHENISLFSESGKFWTPQSSVLDSYASVQLSFQQLI